MASTTLGNNNREKKLITLISEGNQLAFKQIFDLYHTRIFHFSKKYLRSEHLAEEAVQDVFLKLWEKQEELIRIENFSSWLFQLTRNHVLTILKRASNEIRIKEEILKTAKIQTENEYEQIFEKESFDLLHKIVAMLPSQRQKVFKLCCFEEKTYEETAQMMGISKSTVNDHMVKAMKYLKNKVPEQLYE